MKLNRVDNGYKHPLSSMNIEIAHISTDNDNYKSDLYQNIEKSLDLIDNININRYELKTCFSILIDDKRSNINNREKWISDNIFPVDNLKMIDYLCFESDLKGYVSVLYAKLSAEHRTSVSRQMERYINKMGKTACSHDIALWHSLRLGVLGSRTLPVYQVAHKGRIDIINSFIAKNVVSVLNKSDREHEEDAEIDILQYLDPDVADYRRIGRFYY